MSIVPHPQVTWEERSEYEEKSGKKTTVTETLRCLQHCCSGLLFFFPLQCHGNLTRKCENVFTGSGQNASE